MRFAGLSYYTLGLKILPKATGSCNALTSKLVYRDPSVFNDIFGITGLFLGLTKTTVKAEELGKLYGYF